MVKSAKRAIYATIANADVNDEELMTGFTGVEDLLNSRPITYQSADSHDALPLTPNNFLHGRVDSVFAPPSVDQTSFNTRVRWRRVQEIVRQYWDRWMREWVPSIAQRKIWQRIRKDLATGDVVLVMAKISRADFRNCELFKRPFLEKTVMCAQFELKFAEAATFDQFYDSVRWNYLPNDVH